MMKLRSSPPSPFGRKVKLALSILGLKGEVEIEDANTADPSDSLRSQNPLGKIPALVLETATSSTTAPSFWNTSTSWRAAARLFPEGEARFPVLRDQTLADGIMDAAILRVYEKRFKEQKYRDPAWDAYQAAKMERGLKHFEDNTPPVPASAADVNAGALTLACALGYLDIRFAGEWRQTHPKLVAWLDAFEAAVPAFTDTKVPPAPVPDNAPALLQ